MTRGKSHPQVTLDSSMSHTGDEANLRLLKTKLCLAMLFILYGHRYCAHIWNLYELNHISIHDYNRIDHITRQLSRNVMECQKQCCKVANE